MPPKKRWHANHRKPDKLFRDLSRILEKELGWNLSKAKGPDKYQTGLVLGGTARSASQAYGTRTPG